MRQLAIPEQIRDAIVAEAQAAHPRECCGILGGLHGGFLVTLHHQCLNVAESGNRYEMDLADLYDAISRIQERGDRLIAIYHSHPRSSAEPSEEDIELWNYPDAVMLICSVAGDEPVLRGWDLGAGDPAEVDLRAVPIETS